MFINKKYSLKRFYMYFYKNYLIISIFMICLFSNVLFSQNIDISNAETIFIVESDNYALNFSENLFSITERITGKQGRVTVFDGEGEMIFQENIDRPLLNVLSDVGNRILVFSYIDAGPISKIHCFDKTGELLWSENGFRTQYKISEDEAFAIPMGTDMNVGPNRFNILDLSNGETFEPQFDIDYVLFKADFLNEDQVVILLQTSKRSEVNTHSLPSDLFMIVYTISTGNIEYKINLNAYNESYALFGDDSDVIQVNRTSSRIAVRVRRYGGSNAPLFEIPSSVIVLTKEGEFLMDYETDNVISAATTFENNVVHKEKLKDSNYHEYRFVFINTNDMSITFTPAKEHPVRGSAYSFKVDRIDNQLLFTNFRRSFVMSDISNIELTTIKDMNIPAENADKPGGIVKISENLVIINDKRIQIKKQTP